MRILFVGHLNVGQTCRMRMEALRDLGHEVRGVNEQEAWAESSWLSRQLQHRLQTGPVLRSLNARVIEAARELRAEMVWAEKQEHLYPETIDALRRMGAKTLHYTPDPYFSLWWKRTRLMDAAMPRFDYLVTSKQYELADYEKVGPQVIYVPLGFGRDAHRPMVMADRHRSEKTATPLGFVGGWEPRREQLLTALVDQGLPLKVWGHAWDHLVDGRWSVRRAYRLRTNAGGAPFRIRRNGALAPTLQGGEVYGDEYSWVLSGARIGIGFLRHICPDQHTTRSFEIPACGSMLLADRTDEHRELFTEGTEAEYFSSRDELVDKARFYLSNEAVRAKVALAGYDRCHRSGYSYHDRVSSILSRLT